MPAATKVHCAQCGRRETKKTAKAAGWLRAALQWWCTGCRHYAPKGT